MEHDNPLRNGGAIEYSGDAFLALDSQLKEPPAQWRGYAACQEQGQARALNL
jgi:hypothetical protein